MPKEYVQVAVLGLLGQSEEIVLTCYGPRGGNHGINGLTLDSACTLLADLAIAISNIKAARLETELAAKQEITKGVADALLHHKFGERE